MRRINIIVLGGLLLCCACSPTPPASPLPTITSTSASAPIITPMALETSPPNSTVSTPRPTSTLRNTESTWLDFVTPISGDVVSSPIRFSGRTNMVPSGRVITIRLYDQDWNLLAETTAVLQGETGKAGTFSSEITVRDYTGTAILVASSEDGASITTRITVKKP